MALRRRLAGALVACAGACVTPARAGPPFQTDDPDPVDRGHAEINVIGQSQRTAGDRASSLQGEVNLGCAADTQCHVAVPLVRDRPDGASARTGVGDAELGVKWRFFEQGGDGWSAATYPTLYLPTGDARRGLGNGRAQLLLPLWVQRAAGPWRFDAGVGRLFNRAPGARDSWFTGLLAQRAFGERLSVGAEVFRRSAAAVGERAAVGFNVGTIVNVAAGQNLLFSLGRGLANVDADRGSIFLAWQLEH